jgi:hypothetical protein
MDVELQLTRRAHALNKWELFIPFNPYLTTSALALPMQPSDYIDVEQANKELTVHLSKWQQLEVFETSRDHWLEAPCKELSTEEMQDQVGCVW